MDEKPSNLLIDQRIRNRIMDALSCLAGGAKSVELMGNQDYFEIFYDWVDDERPSYPWPVAAPKTMTDLEIIAISTVLKTVNDAIRELANINDDQAIIASGQLEHISHEAKLALDLMLDRGCFHEDFEEAEPTNKSLENILRANAKG